MRHIDRSTGKALIFRDKKEYEAHFEDLKTRGLLKRERSRKVCKEVARGDEWRAQRKPVLGPARRHKRTEMSRPEDHTRWKFSLIHPTRGRLLPARDCFYLWYDLMSSYNDIEYILSLDTDDAANYLPIVQELMKLANFKVVTSPNRNVVQALNNGAKYSTGDVLIYVSDDFMCPENWDVEIQKAVGKEDDWVLAVYDGIQKRVQTISILSRKYYQRLGYIYYPEYISMFADPDFTETAKAMGKMIDGMHLTFKHNHHTVGGLPYDETYARENSRVAWDHGEKLFNKRREENFGVCLQKDA